jgi:hypothetical protein
MERPVVVTTQYRGVFFGYAEDTTDDRITLARARNCLYWSQSVKGVFGLAITGPNSECRIGPAMPSIELRGITAVIETTAEAAEAWEAGPWR